MVERLVTIETTKRLKEKGFNKYCENIAKEDNGWKTQRICNINYVLPESCYFRPSQTIAQKWLRETKNLHICIYNNASGYGYEISKADNGTHISNDLSDGPNDGGKWDTYEEALEAGIQEALKFI